MRVGTLVLCCALLSSGFGPLAAEAKTYAGLPLSEALDALRHEGLRIIYSSDLVTPAMTVEVEPVAATSREILDRLLEPHGLAAKEGPGETLLVVQATGPARTTGEIRGLVRNRESRERLSSVEISIDGSPTTVTSGDDGSFLIPRLSAGSYNLAVRTPGFVVHRLRSVSVVAGQATRLVIELSPAPVKLERVAVTPSHYDLGGREPSGRQFLNHEELNQVPRLSDDLHRAVGRLPGTAVGDRSASFNIRGGENEEVLLVLDGLEIYEPFHLREFFSIVDSDLIGGVDLLTGGFPVEYGDRMSGVIDTSSTTPSGPPQTSFGLSSTSARVRSDGTFYGDRGQWLVSARRGYMDLLLPFLDTDLSFEPTYYDLLGKVQYRLTDRTTVSANVLAAYDNLEFSRSEPGVEERLAAKSGSVYGWLNAKTLWTPRLHSETVVSMGSIDRRRSGSEDTPGVNVSQLRDVRVTDFSGFKQDWTFRLSDRHHLKGGFDVRRLRGEYDYHLMAEISDPLVTGGGDPVAAERDTRLRPRGNDYGAYLADRIRLLPPLTVEVGVRWDRQTHTGLDDDYQISPRVNLAYTPSRRTIWRAGWGRFFQSQGVNELQVEDGVEEFYPAQLSEHLILGYERGFESGIHVRVEAYRKRMSRLRPRYENLFDPFGLYPETAGDRRRIKPSSAEATGVEIALRRRGNRLSWWAGYTLSRAEDVIDGANVPRSWDQRHAARFGLNLKAGRHWNLGLAGEYHSGWPTTAVTAEQRPNPDGSFTIVPIVGPRNAERFPSFHRLDVRASRELPIRRGRLAFFVEVTNLYDRKNPCCARDFDFVPQPDGSVTVERELDYWLPRVPSFGLTWRF